MSECFRKLAFLFCLAALGACHSRLPSQGVPPPSPPDLTSSPAIESPATSERTPSPGTPAAEDHSADCALTTAAGGHITRVALAERIDPVHAPYPSNDSEQLLFRQLYETLVRVDCTGRVLPGLAASWHLDSGGHTWTVRLRDNARFSDGMPLTATELIAAWSINSGSELRAEVRRLVRSIIAVGDRTVEITLHSQSGDAPLALAHSDLAIARHLPNATWPLGTRAARIEAEGGTLTLLPADSEPSPAGESPPAIRFLLASGRDTRDLLDQGVDLLVTRDPNAVNYAATLPQFESVPLAWQRTHVLLTPGRARTSRTLSQAQRDALADDAVRGEARGALAPFWWQSLQDCEIPSPQQQNPPSSNGRIVYEEGDGTARDLAERLVGLVRVSSPGATAMLEALLPDRPRQTFQRATGLAGEALVSARRRGIDAGYIMAVDRRPLAPCRDMQVLLENVGWLDPETIVPLVDTRLQAIIRRDHSGIIAEWDGGLLLAAGPRAPR